MNHPTKKHITAAYTICKDEAKFVEKWLYYTDPYDYRVILDTGSTDGTWQMLEEAAQKDKNLIIEQKIFTTWRFDVARNYKLSMVPKHVEWCLQPDMDEYFSINTLQEMEKIITNVPTVTNISCDRLDLYSSTVRVGPPNHIPSNKIHRRHDYTWFSPIYEHLTWIHKDRYENELYSDDIYLIHDQDFKKKSRPEQYLSMLKHEYETNPQNTWCLWFLVSHYFKHQDLANFITTACDYPLIAKSPVV